MRFSPQLKINLGRVAIITISFVLINIFIAFFNDTILRSDFSSGLTSIYDFRVYLLINIIIGLVAGIFGGGSLVVVNSRLFRKKSFRFAILATAGVYGLIFLIAILINGVISASVRMNTGVPLNEFVAIAFDLMMNNTVIVYFILWGIITLFTLFLLQINDKFGPGMLVKFLMGKYHHPRLEDRIFMFLDMRSSTTIAEKLGNEKYFNLLNDLFADITDTILNHEGEIYQYVGDEIVISWPVAKGIKGANCLQCYVKIKNTLNELSSHYMNKFGVSPELKAGLHHGQVMAGEVGVIKKDIIYSGDVLNTTSRIQEQCNHYQVDLLISEETFNIIEDQSQYELIQLGSIDLRGREQKVNLNTVRFK